MTLLRFNYIRILIIRVSVNLDQLCTNILKCGEDIKVLAVNVEVSETDGNDMKSCMNIEEDMHFEGGSRKEEEVGRRRK